MINIKELSIGNWVKFPCGIDKIVDLPYVEGKGMCASFAASATLFPVSVKDLEPIEITPEILEKNGFYEDGNDVYVDDNSYFIPHSSGFDAGKWETHINPTEGIGDFDGKLKYVHQLQNALKLCGINKKIEL